MNCLEWIWGGVAVGGCIDLQTYSEEVFTRLDYEYNKKYICSGVLLMNLDYWRSYKLSTKIIDFMKKNSDKIKFPDQDALNYLCRDNKIVLEALYGVQTLFFLHKDFMIEHMEEMRMLIDKPSIVHYAGYPPWVYCKNKSMHSYLWWNTYKKLNAFHKVKRDYILSIAKYICRYLFSTLHIISCNNKYHINQYYNHPRVKKNRVEKELKVLNQH